MLSGIILGLDSVNKRRRYNVTPILIGPAYTQNGLCAMHILCKISEWPM